MQVTIKEIAGFRVLRYRYKVNNDIGFDFHLLSEVGEPWQGEARSMAQALADKRNAKIVQIEIDCKPWFVDALV